jgi:hypothetical protein
MSATVIPFPLSRRIAFVERHAEIVSCMTPKSGARHLAYQLKLQHDALERRGIAEDRIEREIASLERAILAASEWEPVAYEQ